MLAGIIVWQAVAESISRMTNTLVENQNLIQKVVFPSEVLPLYLVASSLINMLIGTAITLLGVAWFAYVRPIEYAADAPPAKLTVQLVAPSAEAGASSSAATSAIALIGSARRSGWRGSSPRGSAAPSRRR